MNKDKRFEIKYGRFGAYFYDRKYQREIDLNQALRIMNEWADVSNFGKSLGDIER